jgi:SAM-dependent methyltransferase
MQIDRSAPPPAFKVSLATTYDNHASERDDRGEAAWRHPARAAFLAAMQAEGRARLLEIGAGTGHTARWFADQGLDVVATDLSPDQVGACRDKGLEAYVRDFYELGFAPASFDGAWAANCLLHVPNADLAGVLEHIAAVLSDRGLFYVALWGGVSVEGIYEDDFYLPPRFFAFRTDDEVQDRFEAVFDIEDFELLYPEDETDDQLHVQSMVLRKR